MGILGAQAPPPLINGGVQLAGAFSGANCRNLKIWILNFIRSQIPVPPDVIGETAGLACSQNQLARVVVSVVSMVHEPWFTAVLAQGPPLPYPVGSIWHPRPRSSTGLCDQIPVPGDLWA